MARRPVIAKRRSPVLTLGFYRTPITRRRDGRGWASNLKVVPPSILEALDRASIEEDKPVHVIIREAMEGWYGPDWQPPANNIIPASREVCAAIKARCEPRWGKVLRHYREERREDERQRLEEIIDQDES